MKRSWFRWLRLDFLLALRESTAALARRALALWEHLPDPGRRPKPARPAVEALEPRWVPSTVSFDSTTFNQMEPLSNSGCPPCGKT